MRVPRIDAEAAPLFTTATWANLETQGMPARTTLFDAIAVQNALGRLSDERLQWLADNKESTALIWAGVEQGMAALIEDSDNEVSRTHALALTDALPVQTITRFLLDWNRLHPTLLADDTLNALLTLKHAEDGKRLTQDATTNLCDSLVSGLEAIADHLRRLIDGNIPGEYSFTPAGALVEFDAEGGLAMGFDAMMALELPFDVSDLPHSLKFTFIQTLHLISRHLHPLTLPDEIIEFSAAMMLDEAEEDLDSINAYLTHYDLSEDRDNVEEAIEAVGECFMVACYEDYDHFNSLKQAESEIKDAWNVPLPTSIQLARENFAALPEADTERHPTLTKWLHDTLDAIETVVATHQHPDALDTDLMPDIDGMIAGLRSPVFDPSVDAITNQLQEIHESQMQGLDEEGDGSQIPWSASAEQIEQQAQRWNIGQKLLGKLVYLA